MLGLGTVQFGTHYGVSNKKGAPALSEIEGILSLAENNGVKVIDTATSYGNCESTLGQLLPHKHSFHIVTKTVSFKVDKIDKKEITKLKDTFYHSLEKLRQDRVYGLLVHNVDNLLCSGGQKLVDAICELKSQKLVENIGASVYASQNINSILNFFTPDIIQLPINIFDQRFVVDGVLRKLKALGVKIHARSIFLQGLLLMEEAELPSYFMPYHEHFSRFSRFLKINKLSGLQAALMFAVNVKELDTYLVGVNSSKELQDILLALDNVAETVIDMSDFAIHDETLLNPTYWHIQ